MIQKRSKTPLFFLCLPANKPYKKEVFPTRRQETLRTFFEVYPSPEEEGLHQPKPLHYLTIFTRGRIAFAP